MVKRLPTMRETRVWSLFWEDPPEKEMATHSSTLPWKIPRTEDPGRLQFVGLQRVRHDWATSLSLFLNIQSSNHTQVFTQLTWKLLSTQKPTQILIAVLFIIVKTWKQNKISLNRWMDKQIVLRAYNEILLSDIKKCSIKPPKGMEELKVHITIVKEAYVKRLYIV